MESRLANLLRLVVEDVIQTGEPVGSQRLVAEYGLDVSSATIRNWFAELENRELITQPHTSSGRMPTEKGFRLYLDELMDRHTLSKKEKADLVDSLKASNGIKSLAKTAAEIADNAIILGLDHADTYYTGLSHLFSQPEFKDWEKLVSIGEVLDKLDEVMRVLRRSVFDRPTALIGSQCPFGSACSTMLLTLNDGTLFGILGPMRLDYKACNALLNDIKELTDVSYGK